MVREELALEDPWCYASPALEFGKRGQVIKGLACSRRDAPNSICRGGRTDTTAQAIVKR